MTQSKPKQTRRRFLKAGAATAAAATVPATASAQTSTDDPPGGLFADGFEVSSSDFLAFIRGFQDARQYSLSAGSSLENLADAMRNEFVANEDHWLNYANWLLENHTDVEPLGTTTLQIDVIDPSLTGEDKRVETVLEADYDDTTRTFTAVDWRLENPENPDYVVGITKRHARLATDDLMAFRREYIDESGDDNHELPDDEYLNELAGRYWDGLRLGPESKGVLEVLVGEVDT